MPAQKIMLRIKIAATKQQHQHKNCPADELVYVYYLGEGVANKCIVLYIILTKKCDYYFYVKKLYCH